MADLEIHLDAENEDWLPSKGKGKKRKEAMTIPANDPRWKTADAHPALNAIKRKIKSLFGKAPEEQLLVVRPHGLGMKIDEAKKAQGELQKFIEKTLPHGKNGEAVLSIRVLGDNPYSDYLVTIATVKDGKLIYRFPTATEYAALGKDMS
jgi:hypothetical protein